MEITTKNLISNEEMETMNAEELIKESDEDSLSDLELADINLTKLFSKRREVIIR